MNENSKQRRVHRKTIDIDDERFVQLEQIASKQERRTTDVIRSAIKLYIHENLK